MQDEPPLVLDCILLGTVRPVPVGDLLLPDIRWAEVFWHEYWHYLQNVTTIEGFRTLNHFEQLLFQFRESGTLTLIADYHYDALGRRVEKVLAAGTTTRYLLDGVEVVEEYDAVGTWQARYVYEDGIDHPRCMDRADIADVNGNQNTTEVLRFHYHQQALGSVTEVTQPTGAVVEWVAYDVYGQAAIRNQQGNVVTQSAVGNPYLYTGREYDAEDGVYFYRARHYDSVTGRLLQRDPLGYVDGTNAYEYVRSSPSRRRDPRGLHVPPPVRPGAIPGVITYAPGATPEETRSNAEEAVAAWNAAHPHQEVPLDRVQGLGLPHPSDPQGRPQTGTAYVHRRPGLRRLGRRCYRVNGRIDFAVLILPIGYSQGEFNHEMNHVTDSLNDDYDNGGYEEDVTVPEDATAEEQSAVVNQAADHAAAQGAADDVHDAADYDEKTEGGPDPSLTPNHEKSDWGRWADGGGR